MVPKSYAVGEDVIAEGEMGDTFYIIQGMRSLRADVS
jgi:hypothetical protein